MTLLFSSFYRGILECGKCGENYRRRITKGKAYWICSTYNFFGKEHCPPKQIPEDVLNETVSQVLSLEELNRKVAKIIVSDHQQLTILLKEEDPVIVTWKHKSRRESWTADMKEKARQRAMKGKKDNEENNSHSTND